VAFEQRHGLGSALPVAVRLRLEAAAGRPRSLFDLGGDEAVSTDTNEFPIILPHIAYGVPANPPLSESESRIVDTALGILPHLGPEATVAYLTRASESEGNKHEG
jgi:hypothetical protein